MESSTQITSPLFWNFKETKKKSKIFFEYLCYSHTSSRWYYIYSTMWYFILNTLYINTYIPNSFIVQFCSLQTYTTHQFHKVYKERLERLWIIHEFFEPSSKLFCLWNKPKSSAGQLNFFLGCSDIMECALDFFTFIRVHMNSIYSWNKYTYLP